MTEDRPAEIYGPVSTERIPTGIPGLDKVLGGGLIQGSIYLVMGRPGAGKTTLANQLCYAHVAQKGRAAYFTLLSESHASVLKNLKGMSFFDGSVVNRELLYIGAYRVLRDDKLRGLLTFLQRVMAAERVSLVVLDGVAPARSIAESELELKEFIVELQTLAAMTNCTVILLANLTAQDVTEPEHTMVDGLIELGFERVGRRTLRTIEVLKFRGSEHLLGRHELAISREGMTVHPRLEELLRKRPAPGATSKYVSTGVEGLDAALGSGLAAGTTSVVLGFTGSGKTTLGLQFLAAGAEAGEPGLHLGFYESPERLAAHAESLGISIRKHEQSGRIAYLWQGSYQTQLDGLATRLFETIDRQGTQRLVIDSLEALRQVAVDPDRTIRFLTALTNELRVRGITTLITDETSKAGGPEIELRMEGTSALAENLILLEYVLVETELRRLFSLMKYRSGPHVDIREFTLGRGGLTLAPTSESVAEIFAHAKALLDRGAGELVPHRTRHRS